MEEGRCKRRTVPQCMPKAFSQRVSLKMCTLSKGFACIGDMILYSTVRTYGQNQFLWTNTYST